METRIKVIQSDNCDIFNYMNAMGWTQLTSHWSIQSDIYNCCYHVYSRKTDGNEEIIVLCKGERGGCRLTACFPKEGICDLEAYNEYTQRLYSEFNKYDSKIVIASYKYPKMNYVSIYTLKKLYDFCVHANPFDGNSHPMDRERWKAFIEASAQYNDEKAVSDQLFDILAYQYKFNHNTAKRLTNEYKIATIRNYT